MAHVQHLRARYFFLVRFVVIVSLLLCALWRRSKGGGTEDTTQVTRNTRRRGLLLLLLKKGLSRSDCCCPQLPPPPPPPAALDRERRLQRIMIHLCGIAYKSLCKHDTKPKTYNLLEYPSFVCSIFLLIDTCMYCIEKESSNFLPVLPLPTYRPCHGQAANLPPPPPPSWQLTLPSPIYLRVSVFRKSQQQSKQQRWVPPSPPHTAASPQPMLFHPPAGACGGGGREGKMGEEKQLSPPSPYSTGVCIPAAWKNRQVGNVRT